MGVSCCGCVELRVVDPDTVDPHGIWMKVIEVSPVTDQDYEMFCRLFGVRCLVEGNSWARPIAAGRGLPPATTFDRNYAEFVSWATAEEFEQAYREIDSHDMYWGWTYLLDSMKLFVSKLGSQSVRLVVGFS